MIATLVSQIPERKDMQFVLHYARRLGLNEADCEDCMMEFVLYLLTRDKAIARDDALRRQCARNFAFDVSRTLQRHARRQVCNDNSERRVDNEPSPFPTPHEVAMREAFWSLVEPFLGMLSSDARQMLLAQCLWGQTVLELSHDFGRTVGAVEQTLVRSRRRLRGLLDRAGIEKLDLLDGLTSRS